MYLKMKIYVRILVLTNKLTKKNEWKWIIYVYFLLIIIILNCFVERNEEWFVLLLHSLHLYNKATGKKCTCIVLDFSFCCCCISWLSFIYIYKFIKFQHWPTFTFLFSFLSSLLFFSLYAFFSFHYITLYTLLHYIHLNYIILYIRDRQEEENKKKKPFIKKNWIVSKRVMSINKIIHCTCT